MAHFKAKEITFPTWYRVEAKTVTLNSHSPHLALSGLVALDHFQPMAHLFHMSSACNSCCAHMCMSSGYWDPVSVSVNGVCTVTPPAISYVTYIILAVFKAYWMLENIEHIKFLFYLFKTFKADFAHFNLYFHCSSNGEKKNKNKQKTLKVTTGRTLV